VIPLLLPSGPDFAAGYLAAMRTGTVVAAISPRLSPAHIVAIRR
jgi:acyl-CoA synthetase (AMP-forming)/AMP-acid ligase II